MVRIVSWLVYVSPDVTNLPATKALRTSSQPGLTRALSERLKLNLDPPIYAVDSPGVMMPFLGVGDVGKERGMKLALIGMDCCNVSSTKSS